MSRSVRRVCFCNFTSSWALFVPKLDARNFRGRQFMKKQFLLVCVLMFMAFNTSARELDNKWEAHFVGPKDRWPKTFDKILFEFKVTGDKLEGMAHMGNWPGDAPLSDGRIVGDQISFTATGQLWSTTGYPKLHFAGTVHGEEMKLVIDWNWINGDAESNGNWRLEMEGTKISN